MAAKLPTEELRYFRELVESSGAAVSPIFFEKREAGLNGEANGRPGERRGVWNLRDERTNIY
ncbi:MAG: hypothetical protein PVF76_06955 [Syntrophobacterales bacterium]|jgi:hypothetical protein